MKDRSVRQGPLDGETLGNAHCIVQFNSKVRYGSVDFGLTKEKFHGARSQ